MNLNKGNTVFGIAKGNNAIKSQSERVFKGKTYIVTRRKRKDRNFTEVRMNGFLNMKERGREGRRRMKDDYWRGVR
ncbi:hypothetical protein Q2366_26625, partial [Escherichia coli]|nr:hypothetical protein [Escherichia coli]